jgi:hypothetical protein
VTKGRAAGRFPFARIRIGVALCGLLVPLRASETRNTFPFYIPWDDASPTVVDLSSLTPKPAGAAGFVFVDSGQHLAVKTGRIRFWGVNLSYGANFPEYRDAPLIARHMAKCGINLVRFHHMDSQAKPGGIWTTLKPDRALSAEQLDRLDYFIDQLKRNGIYADLNLLVARPLDRGRDLPKDIDRIKDWRVRLALGFFDKSIFSLEAKYAKALLTHVNSYTGKAYVDEPALAFIEVSNENGLVNAFMSAYLDGLPPYYKNELRGQWNAWLKKKYGTQAALMSAWKAYRLEPGAEMLVNGDFSQGLSSWVLEVHDPAEAGAEVTQEGPAGAPAAVVDVQKTSSVGWHVQFYQPQLRVATETPYTLTFYAEAGSPREIQVELAQAHDPWKNLGFGKPIGLTAAWQKFALTFALDASDDNARLIFTDLATKKGEVRIAAASLKPGGTIGLFPDESLDSGTIRNFLWAGDMERTVEAKKDWYRFLLQTEEAYWLSMRNYLRKTLKARSLLIGTIMGCSTPNLLADFDVVDSHFYWRHPVFPDKEWDWKNWYVQNSSMVNHPGDDSIGVIFMQNILRKPRCVSEYDEPHPNTFQAEAYPLLAAYASLQDLDALVPFGYAFDQYDYDLKKIDNPFDLARNPLKLALFFPAAAAFRRGDIRPAQKRIVAPIRREDEVEALLTSGPGWLVNATSKDEDARAAFIHGVEIAVQGQSIPKGSLAPGTTPVTLPVLASDTGEMTWDAKRSGKAVITVDSERTKFVVGFGSGRTFDLSGVKIMPGSTLQKGFSVIALTVIDGASFAKAKSLILTAAGCVNNTACPWYKYPRQPILFPPAENLNVTLGDFQDPKAWGTAPTRIEGISAKIILPYRASAVQAWALDQTGARTRQLAVSSAQTGAQISIAPQDRAVWYEIEVNFGGEDPFQRSLPSFRGSKGRGPCLPSSTRP